MKRLGKVVKRIWFIDYSGLPPEYFMRPKVAKAVRREVIADIMAGRVRRMPGVKIDWGEPNFWQRLYRMVLEALPWNMK